MAAKESDVVTVLRDILAVLEYSIPPGKLSPRVVRELAPRVAKAKLACFRRGYKPEEITAMFSVNVQEGPAYVRLLEHLSHGKPITLARRKRQPSIVDPALMRNALNEPDEPFEGEAASRAS